jgi:hypothetical protein
VNKWFQYFAVKERSLIISRRITRLIPLPHNSFGSNILSCTGPNWRRQRKSISPSFNEANNALVWSESIFQTTSMLKSWAIESKYKQVNFQEDFKMLAFHVLSRGGFGVRLLWAGHEESNGEKSKVAGEPRGKLLEAGREMRFGEAMLLVVENMKEIFVFPNWFLSMFLHGNPVLQSNKG